MPTIRREIRSLRSRDTLAARHDLLIGVLPRLFVLRSNFGRLGRLTLTLERTHETEQRPAVVRPLVQVFAVHPLGIGEAPVRKKYRAERLRQASLQVVRPAQVPSHFRHPYVGLSHLASGTEEQDTCGTHAGTPGCA